MNSEVVERPERHRFELPVGDSLAVANYWPDGNRVVLVHTEVPLRYRGRDVGSRLAKGMFDILRQTNRKAVLRCSFLVLWARRHPEYNDIIEG
jgi:uncharacterized protein